MATIGGPNLGEVYYNDLNAIISKNPLYCLFATLKNNLGKPYKVIKGKNTPDPTFTRLTTTYDNTAGSTNVVITGPYEIGEPILNTSLEKPSIRVLNNNENLIRYSEDFSQNVWVKNGISAANAQSTAPTGTVVGSILTSTNSNGTIRQTQNMVNRIPLFSIYLKRLSGNGKVFLETSGNIQEIILTNEYKKYQVNGFRLSGNYVAVNGKYTVTSNYVTNLKVSDIVFIRDTSFPGGYTDTVDEVIDEYTFVFNRGTDTKNETCNIVGYYVNLKIENSGDVIEAFGAQVNGYAFYNTDYFINLSNLDLYDDSLEYVKTLNSSVSRGTETLTINSNEMFNVDSGVFYLEFSSPNITNPFYRGVDFISFRNIDDVEIFKFEGYSNRTSIQNSMRFRITPQNSVTGYMSSPLNIIKKIIMKYNGSTLKFFSNGVLISTINITTTLSLNISKINIGGNSIMVNSLATFSDLSDADCIELTKE